MDHLFSFKQTTTCRHFTLMDISKVGYGNTFCGECWHQIPDDDEIQTQHFGFTLFVIFCFNIETSGCSNPQKVVGYPTGMDSLYTCRPRPFTGSTSIGGPKELLPGDTNHRPLTVAVVIRKFVSGPPKYRFRPKTRHLRFKWI